MLKHFFILLNPKAHEYTEQENWSAKHIMNPVQNLTRYFFKQHFNLITPCSKVLLETLTGFAASQEIPRIYGTREFITVLTSARHLSLSWARSIQSPQPPPTSCSILTVTWNLCRGLSTATFLQVFQPKLYYSPHVPAVWPAHLIILLDFIVLVTYG
jgi:hypothetical protein